MAESLNTPIEAPAGLSSPGQAESGQSANWQLQPGDDNAVLVVDLDGTLIRSNLLWESFAAALRESPVRCLLALLTLFQGRAALKRALGAIGPIDPVALPYRRKFLSWLRRQYSLGRQIVLATAADERVADGIALHLRIFDQVLASDGEQNNKGNAKLEAIQRSFPGKSFDYCGDSRADGPLFKAARIAYVVGGTDQVIAQAQAGGNADLQFARGSEPFLWRAWLKAIRPYHWLKNLLVLMPFFSAFLLTDTSALASALIATVAMCLAASSGYLVNDLLDMQADRHHPRKRSRSFASGQLTAAEGFAGAAILQLAALTLAWFVGWSVLLWVAIYLLGTFSYSVFFKREPIIDVLLLAGLYTTRVIVGANAVDAERSLWLLAFSVFFFFSLATMKRCGELVLRERHGEQTTAGRAYEPADLQMLCPVGISAGVAAVLVLALYVQSPGVGERYPVPEALWLALAALLAWLSRAWLDTMRGQMHDDPLIYALRHRRGRLVLILVIASFSAAALWGVAPVLAS
ncbi:MAG: UbiA family prenyltransferase [Burkholderiaceae bacterium]